MTGPYLAYVARGIGIVGAGDDEGGRTVRDGDLVRGDDISFTAEEDVLVVIAHGSD